MSAGRLRSSLDVSLSSNDASEVAGGAIFHTGSLHLVDTSFHANEAGADGPVVLSIGLLEEVLNVSFAENAYQCHAGYYGYLDKTEARTSIPTGSVSSQITEQEKSLQTGWFRSGKSTDENSY